MFITMILPYEAILRLHGWQMFLELNHILCADMLWRKCSLLKVHQWTPLNGCWESLWRCSVYP